MVFDPLILIAALLSAMTVILIFAPVAIGIVKLVRRLKKVIDEPLTVDVELRENMLPTGFYIISGRQRIGKGSLGCAVMDTDCTYHCRERLLRAQEVVDRMNSIPQADPYNLHLPDFPYRSKNNMLLGPEYRDTYHTDISQFALPDGQENVQYFPPFTMIHAEELDAYMNCRTWKDNGREKANTIDAIKWIGHNDLTFIGDAQVFGRIDAAIRAVTTDVWYVLKRKDYYSDDVKLPPWKAMFRPHENRVIRTEWTFLWIKNQMKEQAREVKAFGEMIDSADFVKLCKFNYYGNIYERYDSKSGRRYWYKGIQDFYVEQHPVNDMTREAIDDYCKRNSRRAENGAEENK